MLPVRDSPLPASLEGTPAAMPKPTTPLAAEILGAEVALACDELDETLAFFSGLGFRIQAIFPADAPTVAVLSGHGLRLRLEVGGPGARGVLRLRCADLKRIASGTLELTAPNGTRVLWVDAEPTLVIPPLRPSLVVTRRQGSAWHVGRAGMRYRDLIPDRQGGRVIASHIHIPEAGPVPDYPHFHDVRFQVIVCHRGWVRVVYEDQGPPFVMEAGDCVLQPPKIRHRVLECSKDLEVVELGSPAQHPTFADHEAPLPSPTRNDARDFAGQRFVRHRAEGADWSPWRHTGFECRDTGITEATGGLAGVRFVRADGTPSAAQSTHEAELVFGFVRAGGITLRTAEHAPEKLAEGDAFVIPGGLSHTLTDPTPDLELLDVTLPAEPTFRS